MVTLQQFIDGVKGYAQNGVIPHLPEDRQFIAGVTLGMSRGKIDRIAKYLKDNKFMSMLGLIDDNGMVDDDALFASMRDQMQRQGSLHVDIPWIGRLAFSAQDVDELQRAVRSR